MKEDYHKWYSPILGSDFQMLTFGYSGVPVVLFPSSQGRYYEAKDRGLIDAVGWFVENGYVKIYCPDSIDSFSWYNKSVPPQYRAANHNLYDALIREEVLGRAFYETGYTRAVMAGCSFGGYHAANFGFRHPEMVEAILSMSGIFDIRSQVGDYYDDNVYFNNPVDYLPQDGNPALWHIKIALGTAEEDICLESNKRLSGILTQKNIGHWLDIYPNEKHDWPVWLKMFPKYLSLL